MGVTINWEVEAPQLSYSYFYAYFYVHCNFLADQSTITGVESLYRKSC